LTNLKEYVYTLLPNLYLNIFLFSEFYKCLCTQIMYQFLEDNFVNNFDDNVKIVIKITINETFRKVAR